MLDIRNLIGSYDKYPVHFLGYRTMSCTFAYQIMSDYLSCTSGNCPVHFHVLHSTNFYEYLSPKKNRPLWLVMMDDSLPTLEKDTSTH